MKLELSDIKLMNEGEQAKKAILQKFGSIEEFVRVNDIDLYLETVKSYLRKKFITSETFKASITRAFDMDYCDVVPGKSGQLSRYVELVCDNIKEYKDEKDLEVLVLLRKLCANYKLPVEKGKMYNAIGMYHFYKGDYRLAVENLEIAHSIFTERYENKLVIMCSSDMALVYNYQGEYQKGLEKCAEIESMLSKTPGLDAMVFFLFYYRWGIILNNMNRYELAREKLEISFAAAPRKFDEANAILNLGLVLKKQKKYPLALQYYEKALRLFEPEDKDYISIVYNNIAEIYRVKKDYDTALCILDKAFSIMNGVDGWSSQTIFQTYVQVKTSKGETDIALNKLLNMTAKMEKTYQCKKFIISGFEIIIENGKRNKNLLEEVIEILLNTIREAGEEDSSYTDKLKLMLGNAFFNLKSI